MGRRLQHVDPLRVLSPEESCSAAGIRFIHLLSGPDQGGPVGVLAHDDLRNLTLLLIRMDEIRRGYGAVSPPVP